LQNLKSERSKIGELAIVNGKSGKHNNGSRPRNYGRVAPQSSPETTDTPTEPPPAGLTLVHIIGTKYIDYFTDGSTTVSFPGNSDIDANLNKPDAPIPTHEGMTWVHTTGQNLYDTPSGDLEVGDYAVQQNGSYIENAPPTVFVPSTSTPAVLGASTSTAATSDTTSTSSSTPQSDNSTTTDQGASSTPPATDTTATTTP
jgi:hypothetical protein